MKTLSFEHNFTKPWVRLGTLFTSECDKALVERNNLEVDDVDVL